MKLTMKTDSNSSTIKADNSEALVEIIKQELILNNICKSQDVKVLDQRLEIKNLLNYSGNFFENEENSCFIRCFNNTPTLVAVICEYVYDEKKYDVKGVEKLLKNRLDKLGLTSVNAPS